MSNDPIYSRRSIRRFKSDPVAPELISEVLDAARMAPSPKNSQPWKYLVFGGEHKTDMLSCMQEGIEREEWGMPVLPRSVIGIPDAKNTLRVMQEAPIVILVLNINGKSPFLPLDHDDRIIEVCDTLSIGASMQNLILKAEELGLGTLWIANTFFAYEELTDYLQTEAQLIGAIALGYANEAPMKRPRKEISEIAEFRL